MGFLDEAKAQIKQRFGADARIELRPFSWRNEGADDEWHMVIDSPVETELACDLLDDLCDQWWDEAAGLLSVKVYPILGVIDGRTLTSDAIGATISYMRLLECILARRRNHDPARCAAAGSVRCASEVEFDADPKTLCPAREPWRDPLEAAKARRVKQFQDEYDEQRIRHETRGDRAVFPSVLFLPVPEPFGQTCTAQEALG